MDDIGCDGHADQVMHVTSRETRAATRGPALLAFAGKPTPAMFATMAACAENLGRDLVPIDVGSSPGGVITTAPEVARVVAEVRRSGAAAVVVAGSTRPQIVRQLAAAARRPVLVARTRGPWKRVLAASDLETRGLPVLTTGATVAATTGADSLMLHNIPPGWVAPTAPLAAGGSHARGMARRLRRFRRSAERLLPRSEVIVSSAGSPERAIVDAFVARDAELLVVGMRRPDPRARSRCADQILASTPGNVLVVPVGPGPRRLKEVRR